MTKGMPIPYGIMLTSKSWGKKEKGERSECWCLLFPLCVMEDCLPLEMAKYLPVDGK